MAGHLKRMIPGRIPKDTLYIELASGKMKTCRQRLRFQDVCQRDTKAARIRTSDWECKAADWSTWRTVVKEGIIVAEERRMEEATDKRARRKAKVLGSTELVCESCGKDCHSRIGLHSQTRKCNPTQRWWSSSSETEGCRLVLVNAFQTIPDASKMNHINIKISKFSWGLTDPPESVGPARGADFVLCPRA